MTVKAVYKFRFYELDQPIKIGEASEFSFFIDPHTAAAPPNRLYEGLLWIFHNTLGQDFVSLKCSIQRIWHPELGLVREIDTKGFTYRIVLVDGTVVTVEAEESPGLVLDGGQSVTDWLFLVDVKEQG